MQVTIIKIINKVNNIFLWMACNYLICSSVSTLPCEFNFVEVFGDLLVLVSCTCNTLILGITTLSLRFVCVRPSQMKIPDLHFYKNGY